MQTEPGRHVSRGLGRRVADIVEGHTGQDPGGANRSLVSVPSVVPFEVVPVAMLLADSRAQVVAANARWSEWSKLGVEDSLGSGWTVALGDEERRVVTTELVQIVREMAEGAAGPSARAVMGPGRRWWLAPFESSGQMLIGIVVAESGTDETVTNTSQTPDPAGTDAPGSPVKLGHTSAGRDILKGVEAVIEVMTELALSLNKY